MANNKIRTLKVAEVGDYHRGKTVPQIRLKGKWLQEAGIQANSQVRISNPQPGVLVISPRCGEEGGISN